MSRIVTVALMLALTMIALPVHASLSQAEKDQIAKLGVAHTNLTSGMLAIGRAIPAANETVVDIGAAFRLALNMSDELAFTTAFLLDTNGGFDFTVPSPSERAFRVTQAWFHLDRVAMYHTMLLDSLKGATSPDVQSARDWWLQLAGAYSTIDRTLTYTDPKPRADGKLVGPHGDFLTAEWHGWRAWDYTLQSALSAFAAYPAANVDWYGLSQTYPLLANSFAAGMIRIADIDVTDGERAQRALLAQLPAGQFGVQFWFILALAENVTAISVNSNLGVPGMFHVVGASLADGGPEVAQARRFFTDAWRHSDNFAWDFFGVFPGCNLQVNPAGCAARLPSQQPLVPSSCVIAASPPTGKPSRLSTLTVTCSVSIRSVVVTVGGTPQINASPTQSTFSAPLSLPKAPTTVDVTVINAAGDTSRATLPL